MTPYVWRKGTAGILRDDPGPPKGSEGTNRQLSMSSIGIRGLWGGDPPEKKSPPP